MKWSILLLALPLLTACDGGGIPAEPKPPAPPKVQSPLSNSEPVGLPAPVESDETPAKIEIELEPVISGDPEELPSERVMPDPDSKPVATIMPKKKEVAVENVELPEPALDLSLPEDWSEQLEPGDDAATMTLLPPLFESSDSSRSVQMSGRLLSGEQDEALIDGAQINFELKR